MRAIIAAYHKCCASLIERNGGFVAKYMGDGVLARLHQLAGVGEAKALESQGGESKGRHYGR